MQSKRIFSPKKDDEDDNNNNNNQGWEQQQDIWVTFWKDACVFSLKFRSIGQFIFNLRLRNSLVIRFILLKCVVVVIIIVDSSGLFELFVCSLSEMDAVIFDRCVNFNV